MPPLQHADAVENQSATLKAALLAEDATAVSRLLDAHPALLTPALWPIAIFQAKSLAMTRLLLDRGLNPDECSAPRKPLHLAVYQCLPDIVELLIARGADVHLRNPLGETPLELLDAYEPRPVGDPDSARIRQALLQAGARDDLFTLVRAGETDLIRQLLQNDPELIRTKTDGSTALYFAARSGRVEVARLLLEFGAAPDPGNDVANTPLWFAAQSPARPASHRIAIMKMLLTAGADINRRCEDGSTALHFAAWRGPVEVVEFLLSQGAKSGMLDDNEKGPIDYARMAEDSPDKTAIVKLLTEARI